MFFSLYWFPAACRPTTSFRSTRVDRTVACDMSWTNIIHLMQLVNIFWIENSVSTIGIQINTNPFVRFMRAHAGGNLHHYVHLRTHNQP